MPKLDGTHIIERLQGRLEELRSDREVAARDLRALLTEQQVIAMDAAWAEQQQLRKMKRARTKEEEIALGWKSKREIQIAAYERAVDEADSGMIDTIEQLQRKDTVRQARIYMDSYSKAMKDGKTNEIAKNLANNDLTRAGLRRVDGQNVWIQNKRDKEVWEMEQQILGRIRGEMTQEELEQVQILEEYEKTVRSKGKKLGR